MVGSPFLGFRGKSHPKTVALRFDPGRPRGGWGGCISTRPEIQEYSKASSFFFTGGEGGTLL